jgi:ATP synthase F1 delta subunit
VSYAVARRYSAAFYASLGDEDRLQEARQALTSLGDLIKTSEELRAFAVNPLLTIKEKAGILHAVFGDRLPAAVDRFVQFINSKDRLGFLPAIIEAFEDLYLEEHGQAKAQVETAIGLSPKDRDFLTVQLKNICGKDVVTDFRLNPDLLGGFRIWVQGRLFDASLQTQLADFTLQLT